MGGEVGGWVGGWVGGRVGRRVGRRVGWRVGWLVGNPQMFPRPRIVVGSGRRVRLDGTLNLQYPATDSSPLFLTQPPFSKICGKVRK